MGFFKWLFGRKKREEEQENWEEIVYERDNVDFDSEEERTRYVINCLEQKAEAERELNLLSGEYSLVTSYLTDMEEIESLPQEQMAELKGVANKMLSLDKERMRYLSNEKRMSDAEFKQIRSQESEIEEGIGKLKDAEKYQKLIKQDLTRLDGERHAYTYRKNELANMLVNLRGMAVICLVALGACFVMLLVLQFIFEMNTTVGYCVAVIAAAIAITVLFVKYTDSAKELTKVEKAINRLIQLQNKVKIRYVNNVNLLDYLYLKYNVESAAKLQALWKKYQEEKEERRQFAENEAKLEYYKKKLVSILSGYRVKDPDRWVLQPGAIVDPKEMIEIRHGLIIRRQALRKQMDYNKKLADTANEEIRSVAADYPRYATEISYMVQKYAKDVLPQ